MRYLGYTGPVDPWAAPEPELPYDSAAAGRPLLSHEAAASLNRPNYKANYGAAPKELAARSLVGGAVPLTELHPGAMLKNPLGTLNLGWKNIKETVTSNPSAAMAAGGALLAGKIGDWMGDAALKESKKWTSRITDQTTVDPYSMGGELDEAMARAKASKVADLGKSARKAGTAAMAGGKTRAHEAAGRVVREAVPLIEDAVNRANIVRNDLRREGSRHIGTGIVQQGRLRTGLAGMNATQARAFGDIAVNDANQVAARWQRGIMGFTKMAAFVMTAGQSGVVDALSQEVASYGLGKAFGGD